MQPTIADVMCWAHSTEQPSDNLLIGPAGASAAANSHVQGFDLRKCGVHVPLHQVCARLPDFLRGLQEPLVMAGVQLRFLAQLPQCRDTIDTMQRSASQQVRIMRNVARAEVPGMTDQSFHHPLDASSAPPGSEVAATRWACRIAWTLHASASLQQVSTDATRERAAAAGAMLSSLRAARQAAASKAHALRLAQLQALTTMAVEREQAAQRRAEAVHSEKLQMLRAAAVAAAHEADAKQVRHICCSIVLRKWRDWC